MARRKKIANETTQVAQLNIENQPMARQQGGKVMAKANKWLTETLYESTIGKVLFIDKQTGMELYSASLKSPTISKTGSKTTVKAGENNVSWLEFINDEEIKISVTDIQSKRDWKALKLGGVLESKSVELHEFPKVYEIKSGKITLAETPLSGDVPVVYNSETGEVIQASLEEDKVLTLTGADGLTSATVGSYKYSATAEAIDIADSTQPREVEILISSPVANQAHKVVFDKIYHFYRASLPVDFTDENTSERSESAITTELTVLKDPTKDKLGVLVYKPRA